MNPDYYVEKARKAILTNQPNLAMLYMNRGTQILEQRRRAYMRRTLQGQLTLLGEDMYAIAEEMANSFAPAVEAAAKSFNEFHFQMLKSMQIDYALVSE
jgi:2-keto-3-deoxy-galactonokinase